MKITRRTCQAVQIDTTSKAVDNKAIKKKKVVKKVAIKAIKKVGKKLAKAKLNSKTKAIVKTVRAAKVVDPEKQKKLEEKLRLKAERDKIKDEKLRVKLEKEQAKLEKLKMWELKPDTTI